MLGTHATYAPFALRIGTAARVQWVIPCWRQRPPAMPSLSPGDYVVYNGARVRLVCRTGEDGWYARREGGGLVRIGGTAARAGYSHEQRRGIPVIKLKDN